MTWYQFTIEMTELSTIERTRKNMEDARIERLRIVWNNLRLGKAYTYASEIFHSDYNKQKAFPQTPTQTPGPSNQSVTDNGDKKPGTEPVIPERMRVWEHSAQPGNNCYRKDRKVHLPPGKLPDPCRGGCDSPFDAKGYVWRNSKTKEVLGSEK